MEAITITLPAIDVSSIETISQLNTQAVATETEAFGAIREKYANLAKQNGYVEIAWTWCGDGSNWSEEKDYYYERGGKRIKALLCSDGFYNTNSSQNSGLRLGHRLYLLETSEWLRIERDGHWSNHQGAPESWSCGNIINDEDSRYEEDNKGSIQILTDAEVAAEYKLADVTEQLSKSLGTLAQKLPERMAKLKQRVFLAEQLLAAIK
ncbi:unnamed protein product [Sphagnum tenellum]